MLSESPSARSEIRVSWPSVLALLATAGLTALPALVDLIEHLQATRSPGLAPWALISLGVAALELAYIPYLTQFARRAAYRVVAIVLLAVAMACALLLGVAMLSGVDGRVVGWLGLSNSLPSARLWCAVLTVASTLSALVVGRR
ncbi:MAG: hypothetical protein U0939_11100 [Pirellulales bacterium]